MDEVSEIAQVDAPGGDRDRVAAGADRWISSTRMTDPAGTLRFGPLPFQRTEKSGAIDVEKHQIRDLGGRKLFSAASLCQSNSPFPLSFVNIGQPQKTGPFRDSQVTSGELFVSFRKHVLIPSTHWSIGIGYWPNCSVPCPDD